MCFPSPVWHHSSSPGTWKASETSTSWPDSRRSSSMIMRLLPSGFLLQCDWKLQSICWIYFWGGPPRIAVRHQSLYIPWMMRSLGKMVTASVQGKFRQVSQRFVRWQLVRSVVFRFESWGSTESASIASLQLSICFNDTMTRWWKWKVAKSVYWKDWWIAGLPRMLLQGDPVHLWRAWIRTEE